MKWFNTQTETDRERADCIRSSLSHNGKIIYAGSLLKRAAQLFPHRCAIIVPAEKQYTYERLWSHAAALSAYFEKHGLSRGAHVTILMENSYLFYVAYYGAWQAGAVVIPLNIFLHEKELSHIIRESQPSIMIVSDTLAHKLESVHEILPQILTDQTIAQQIQSAPTSKQYDIRPLPDDAPSVILYTSGTTGMPKGVILSSRAIMSNIIQSLTLFKFAQDERILCPLPLFHSFTQNTCIWSSTACGATVIIVPKIIRSHLVEGVACNPTVIIGVPGLFGLFCRMRDISFPTVRYFCSGGDALPHNIRRYFALRFGRKLCNGYGLTETAPVISAFLEDYMVPTHTVGRHVIDMQIDIRDKTDSVGTLWVTGPNLMNGYYNAPDATAAILQNHWLNTGDLVTQDAQGNIIICGREKDLIVHKGIKIYPQEIETILSNHPQILASAVIGISDPADGEYPVAYIQRGDGEVLDIEALRLFCEQRLAPYKVPKQFFVIEQLPLTSTGKIDKKLLRASYTPPSVQT